MNRDMKIAIGADHAGFELKEKLKAVLIGQGRRVIDEGTADTNSVDYPDFAAKVAHDVADGKAQYGLLVCGSGVGMAIAANKIHGIRAANVNNLTEAQLSREHNDANVLAIGARMLKEEDALKIVDTFLNTAFAHGRHDARVAKIAALEKNSL
jgi:ribose 5-phosphate isomerase B